METDTNHIARPWSLTQKITFRFFFIYFLLFIFINNNSTFPEFHRISALYQNFLYDFIPWVGKTLLGITYTIRTGPNGSGDTTYDYVLLFTIFLSAILTTLIWSIIDRKSSNYNKLYYWLTVAIRFYVGFMLMNYGFAKLFKTQFPYPSLLRLSETYGDSSPMGLAWTFMGFSNGYNIFMGIAEVAAVLLLFRKTVTIGAIISLMTALNVMAVNYFFDVPVKIISTHLVLMLLFLLAENFHVLVKFFFNNKMALLSYPKRPYFKNEIVNKALNILKVLIIGFSLYNVYYYTFKVYPKYFEKPELYGLFEMENFNKNGEELIHFKDTVRWENIQISNPQWLSIKKLNETLYFKHNIDTIERKITLTKFSDSTKSYIVNYKQQDSIYNFKVIMDNDTLTGNFIRKTEKDFLLMNRGFNWINEWPFNK
ncbi:hypothetical protein [Mesoflavibacter sp. CH_XMU1404-2]|uniref:hypothetical protein n=1 Tax=Mesoflavibacter sp. CH_XMU1404-2 TaxID=3107766 RepID=UPI0030094D86